MTSLDPSDQAPDDSLTRYADLLAAMGAEPRLRIIRALMAAHPDGLVVGEITAALGISGSTLSHHLERLKVEHLVSVQRQSNFLRYRVDVATIRQLVAWFVAECCIDTEVLDPRGTATASSSSSRT
jgi:ArsR family transcriptional regulator